MQGEDCKISQLITEENLAKALGVSKQALYQCRRDGCPWFSIGGHVYYHQTKFMEWLLTYRERSAGEDETER